MATVNADFWVPDDAVKYILLQRAYFRLPVTFAYRHLFRHLPIGVPIYNATAAVESRFGRDRVKRLYRRDIAAEYQTLCTVLPASCSSVLDIGCGVAGIDVLLERHYAGASPTFYLLDKTQVERSVYYLFRQQAAFYNSLDVAATMLTCNGIAPERVRLLHANERNDITVDQPIDVVLSLLSWGFHFPVETYCERVRELLSERGVVILDVRRGIGGIDVLRRAFARVTPIYESEKFQRVVAMQ